MMDTVLSFLDSNLNVVLFFGSVAVYSGLWRLHSHWGTRQNLLKRLAILSALCIPWSIGGNTWTALGSARNAEGSVYSVMSFYQNAKKDAVSLFSFLGEQEAGMDTTVLIGGISGRQVAGFRAIFNLGASLYQRGHHVSVNAGFSAYQKAYMAQNEFGVSVYQDSEAYAGTVGLAFVQKAGDKTRTFTFGEMKADRLPD